MRISLLFLILLSLIAHPISAKIVYEFETPINAMEKRVKADLDKSNIVSSTITFLNDVIKTEEDVQVIMGADIGPVYNFNRIFIPYGFLDHIRETLDNSRHYHPRGSIERSVDDFFVHTLIHEFAHAIIDQYDIPVLGREEDAADSLANFLILHHNSDGAEILTSVADVFYLQSKGRRYKKADYASEHSLDIQRYYSILCHAYGSDFEKNGSIRRKADFSRARAESCVYEFDAMAASWVQLLRPYLK